MQTLASWLPAFTRACMHAPILWPAQTKKSALAACTAQPPWYSHSKKEPHCRERFVFVNLDACMAAQGVTVAVVAKLKVREMGLGLPLTWLQFKVQTSCNCSCRHCSMGSTPSKTSPSAAFTRTQVRPHDLRVWHHVTFASSFSSGPCSCASTYRPRRVPAVRAL